MDAILHTIITNMKDYKMKILKNKLENIEYALKIVSDYEANGIKPYESYPENFVFHSLKMFIKELESIANTYENNLEKLKLIEAFEILSTISFGKLKQEICGFN